MFIGVFHPQDPFAVMPSDRVSAIVAEAANQDVQLIFFNEQGIALKHKTVSGTVNISGEWVSGEWPFPPAVMNVRPWDPRKRSTRELIFRKMVPFTAFLIGTK